MDLILRPETIHYNERTRTYLCPSIQLRVWRSTLFPLLHEADRNRDVTGPDNLGKMRLAVYILMMLVMESYTTPRKVRKSVKYEDEQGQDDMTFTSGYTINQFDLTYQEFYELAVPFFSQPVINIKHYLAQHPNCDFELYHRIVTVLYEARNLLSAVLFVQKLQREYANVIVPGLDAESYRRQIGFSNDEIFDAATVRVPATREKVLDRIKRFYQYNLEGVEAPAQRDIVRIVLNRMFNMHLFNPIIQILRPNTAPVAPLPNMLSLAEMIPQCVPQDNPFDLAEISALVATEIRSLMWMKGTIFSYAIDWIDSVCIVCRLDPLDRDNATASVRDRARVQYALRLGVIDHTVWLALDSENDGLRKVHIEGTAQLLSSGGKAFLQEKISGRFTPQDEERILPEIFQEIPDRENIENEACQYWKGRESMRARQIHITKILIGTTCWIRYFGLRPGHPWFYSGVVNGSPRNEMHMWSVMQITFLMVFYTANEAARGFNSVQLFPMDIAGELVPDDLDLYSKDFACVFNRILDHNNNARAETFRNDNSDEARLLSRAVTAHRGNLLFAGDGQDNELDRSLQTSLVTISEAADIDGAKDKVRSVRTTLGKRLACATSYPDNPSQQVVMQSIGRSYLMPLIAFVRTFMNTIVELGSPAIMPEISNVAFHTETRDWHLRWLRHISIIAMNVLPLDWKFLAENEFSRPALSSVIGIDNVKLNRYPQQQRILPPAESLEESYRSVLGVEDNFVRTPVTVWPRPGSDFKENLTSYLYVENNARERIIELLETTGKEIIRTAVNQGQGHALRRQVWIPFAPNQRLFLRNVENPTYSSYFVHSAMLLPWSRLDAETSAHKISFQRGLIQLLGRGNVTMNMYVTLTHLVPTEFSTHSDYIRSGDRVAICSPRDLRGEESAFNVRHILRESTAKYYIANVTNGEVANMTEEEELSDFAERISKYQVVTIWRGFAAEVIAGVGERNCIVGLRDVVADRIRRDRRQLSVAVIPSEEQFAIYRVAETWAKGAWPDFKGLIEGLKFSWPNEDSMSFEVITRSNYVTVNLTNNRRRVDPEGEANPFPGSCYDCFAKSISLPVYLHLTLYRKDAATPVHLISTSRQPFPTHGEINAGIRHARFDRRFDISCEAFNHLLQVQKAVALAQISGRLEQEPNLQQIAPVPAQQQQPIVPPPQNHQPQQARENRVPALVRHQRAQGQQAIRMQQPRAINFHQPPPPMVPQPPQIPPHGFIRQPHPQGLQHRVPQYNPHFRPQPGPPRPVHRHPHHPQLNPAMQMPQGAAIPAMPPRMGPLPVNQLFRPQGPQNFHPPAPRGGNIPPQNFNPRNFRPAR